MKKDRAIALRVNGDVWDKFKELATTQGTNATELICQFMENSIGIVPIQRIDETVERIDDMPRQSPNSVLVERIDGLENRIGVLENRAIASVPTKRKPSPLAVIDSIPRNKSGGINMSLLSSQFGTNDATLPKWIRGAKSDSPARIEFDRWCQTNPAAYQELVDRFTGS